MEQRERKSGRSDEKCRRRVRGETEERDARPTGTFESGSKSEITINFATLLVDRAKLHLQACEDVIKALQVRKQIILESNIDDWEYTNKLAEFERLFLHIEKRNQKAWKRFRIEKK